MSRQQVIAEEIAEHVFKHRPRDMGNLRSAYQCSCGDEIVTDVFRGVSFIDAASSHLAKKVLQKLQELEES